MKKKKSTKKQGNFTVRGVSFPNEPDVISIAEDLAKGESRNFSSFIVNLILEKKSQKETING